MNNFRTTVFAGLLVCTGAALPVAAMAECHDEVVYKERPSADHHHVVGTVVGAVIGGAIGHQIGGGSGKTLATAGGAVAGGAIGHHVAKEHDHEKVRTVERVCTPPST
jgi:uncharacterized protein YcfJ